MAALSAKYYIQLDSLTIEVFGSEDGLFTFRIERAVKFNHSQNVEEYLVFFSVNLASPFTWHKESHANFAHVHTAMFFINPKNV